MYGSTSLFLPPICDDEGSSAFSDNLDRTHLDKLFVSLS